MTDYSQSGEQALILDWAERRGPGRWLDIGAADGITASNTRALAEHGWPGVAVEPAAWAFDKLVALYADRDDVACVQAIVDAGDWYGSEHSPRNLGRLARFHYSRDLVSTTQPANADTWAEVAAFATVYAAVSTLDEMLEKFPGPYAFVSIDTEGTSIALFDELRVLDAFAPGALAVVEAEDGNERWEIQQACLSGWARVGVTPNNVLLEKL